MCCQKYLDFTHVVVTTHTHPIVILPISIEATITYTDQWCVAISRVWSNIMYLTTRKCSIKSTTTYRVCQFAYWLAKIYAANTSQVRHCCVVVKYKKRTSRETHIIQGTVKAKARHANTYCWHVQYVLAALHTAKEVRQTTVLLTAFQPQRAFAQAAVPCKQRIPAQIYRWFWWHISKHTLLLAHSNNIASWRQHEPSSPKRSSSPSNSSVSPLFWFFICLAFFFSFLLRAVINTKHVHKVQTPIMSKEHKSGLDLPNWTRSLDFNLRAEIQKVMRN